MERVTRKATVASQASNVAKRYETDANTWEEFSAEIKDLISPNVEAILSSGGTNVTMKEGSYQLPTQDFKLFLVPVQNKAGN